MKNDNNSWSISNIVAIVILGALVILGGHYLGKSVGSKQSSQVAGTDSTFQPIVEKTISYDGQKDKTALDILKATHQVQTQDSSFGVFVTSIDDTANTDNKFWMFYVNGTLSTVSSDQYKTSDSEKIEWRYEVY